MNRFLETISRVTPATLLVRGMTFVFTVIAVGYAIPSVALDARTILVSLIAGVAVALAPATRIVTVVLTLAVLGWMVGYMGRLGDLSPLTVVVFTSALYLAHSSATLAAAIPTDAVVSPEVLVRWYGRAFVIVAASAVAALVLILGASMIAGFNGTFVASLIGLIAAAALVIALVRQARR
jgi:hypothetical protein